MTTSGRIGVVDIVAVIEDVDGGQAASVAILCGGAGTGQAGVIVGGCPADVLSQAVHLDGERQFVTDERIG